MNAEPATGILLCDCDYDCPDRLTWVGVEEGIPRFVQALEEQAQVRGEARPRITWCVRSDLQMERVYGDCAWPFRRFEAMWRELEAAGDDIAWHPHLWRWSEDHNCWYQETEDADWIERCLRAGYATICEACGRKLRTCRMGWEYHSDLTMGIIDELGIEVDLSATPGRRRHAVGDRGSMRHGELDWSITGAEPYHPSRADYRRPPRDGEAALSVLEVPRTTARSAIWGVGRALWGVANALRRGDLGAMARMSDVRGYVHAPPLTAHPRAFRPLLRHWSRHASTNGSPAAFVTCFHADELSPGRGSAYSFGNATTNADAVLEAAGRPVGSAAYREWLA